MSGGIPRLGVLLTLSLCYQRWETARAFLAQPPFIYLTCHFMDSLLHSHSSTGEYKCCCGDLLLMNFFCFMVQHKYVMFYDRLCCSFKNMLIVYLHENILLYQILLYQTSFKTWFVYAEMWTYSYSLESLLLCQILRHPGQRGEGITFITVLICNTTAVSNILSYLTGAKKSLQIFCVPSNILTLCTQSQ